MAKKNKTMVEIKEDVYVCPKCKQLFNIPLPCPKCHTVVKYGIPPIELAEMKEFLKKNKLNYIKLYLFGTVLCYDEVGTTKGAAKKAPKKAAKKKNGPSK